MTYADTNANKELTTWTIREFLSKATQIDVNPVGQRPSVSPNPEGGAKASKQQSIINSILDGRDIGEIKLVKESGPFKYESIDGGNRKRAILSYLRGEFATHKSSVVGAKKASELSESDLERLMNYELRFVIYNKLSVRQKGELFRDTNNTTPVNQQETLNSYGDIPIANLIRESARVVAGVDNQCHQLFSCYTTASGNVVYQNVAFDNVRLRIDEIVARMAYMVYNGEKPVTASFDSLQGMYDDESLDAKAVKTLKKKLDNALDFLLKCSVHRQARVKRGLTNKQVVMLYRLYFYFKSTYGEFKINDYSKFWDQFEKAFNVFSPSNPQRQDIVENNRLIHEAFNQHLGEHKTQFKLDNTIQWILEEMDLNEATLVTLDKARTFSREMIELKLAEQGYKCWVDGAPLTMANAQGGHIVPHSQGGKSEYDNLVVISAEHNRRMQDTNAHVYKENFFKGNVA
jgi:5-methylcytosine-specific restriction endonuclease McrA